MKKKNANEDEEGNDNVEEEEIIESLAVTMEKDMDEEVEEEVEEEPEAPEIRKSKRVASRKEKGKANTRKIQRRRKPLTFIKLMMCPEKRKLLEASSVAAKKVKACPFF